MATRREKEKREQRVVSAKRRVTEHTDTAQRTSLTLPDGAQLFSLKNEDAKRLNILPYKAGKGNPYADKGEMHYERTYFCHGNIGPNQRAYVCLAETFKKPCPICEEVGKLKRKGADWELIKTLLPKERQLFNVQDITDEKEAAKGVQLWDISFHLFGKLLDKRVRNADEGDDYEFFADPEKGFVLKLEVEEKTMGKKSKPFFNVIAIDFKQRKKPLDEDLLAGVFCLDEIPKELSYKELKEIFLQTKAEDDDDKDDEEENPRKKAAKDDEDDDDDKDDEENEAPKKKKSKKDDDDEDEEDEEEESEAPCEVGDLVAFPHPRNSKKVLKGKVKTVNADKEICTIDSGGEKYVLDFEDITKVEDEDDEDEDDEDEDEDEKPAKKKKAAKDEEDDEDEDDEEEDEDDEDEDDLPKRRKR